MTPNVQYIPAAVSAGPNWQVDASVGAITNSGTRLTLTSVLESGETGNFDANAISPVRRISTFVWVEFLMLIDTSGDYASVSDFQSSTSNRVYSMSVDNVTLAHTSVTEVAASSTLLRVRLNCSATDGQAWWGNVDVGDDFTFSLTYS